MRIYLKDNVRISVRVEHANFVLHKLSIKNVYVAKSCMEPFIHLCSTLSFSLYHTICSSVVSRQVSRSHIRVTLAPCWFTCFVCNSFILHASLSCLFYFLDCYIPHLSHSDLLLCQRNSNTFWEAHAEVRCGSQKFRICFTFRLDNAVIARKVSSLDRCSIKPSPAGI